MNGSLTLPILIKRGLIRLQCPFYISILYTPLFSWIILTKYQWTVRNTCPNLLDKSITGRTKVNAFERFSHKGEGNRLNPYFYGSFATDFPLNFKKRKSFSNVFPFEWSLSVIHSNAWNIDTSSPAIIWKWFIVQRKLPAGQFWRKSIDHVIKSKEIVQRN